MSDNHSTQIYGIPNCDSVRKARRWLENSAIPFRFHDFRKDGLSAETIEQWLLTVTWDQLLNRKSTTWKQLSDEIKLGVNSDNIASLLTQHVTLIKRPVLVHNSDVVVGFTETKYQSVFHK